MQRLPAPPTARKQLRSVKKEWAHVVDVNQELVNVSDHIFMADDSLKNSSPRWPEM